MQELKPFEYDRARPLFEGVDYSLSIQAAIAGNNSGRIFVDDVQQPRTAFALTVEGYFLVGDDEDLETLGALRRFLSDKIFTGEVFVNGDESMSLAVHPAIWEARLPELIPTHEMEKIERYHYLCRALAFDWRENVPEGYTVRRVDRTLLDDSDVVFPDPLRDWTDFEQMWGSEENFFSKGISYVVLHDGEVVAWCTPDCVAGDRIDVGIITHPAHRRRGLASVAVAATVEDCFKHGFNAVGWHCNARNRGSWKTAEKVGFERICDYAYYYYIYDPVDHLAELGWYYYLRGEYDRTVQYYKQVFSLRDENPDYYFHLAASAWALLDNAKMALKYLNAAAEAGWSNIEWTEQQEEFQFLHNMPEWGAVLAKMATAAGNE
jgi:RimJ/RimL family protein N-acetyltransferase